MASVIRVWKSWYAVRLAQGSNMTTRRATRASSSCADVAVVSEEIRLQIKTFSRNSKKKTKQTLVSTTSQQLSTARWLCEDVVLQELKDLLPFDRCCEDSDALEVYEELERSARGRGR